MVNPEYILRKVSVSIPVSIVSVQEKCRPFVSTMLQGWLMWIPDLNPKGSVVRKRDFAAKILGGIGTGLGIKNAVDAESLVTKIRNIGQDVTGAAIIFFIGKIVTLEYDITQVMSEWFRAQQGNDRVLLGGLQKLQDDMVCAIACSQAQTWLSYINSAFLREGWSGNIPVELRRLLRNKLKVFEIQNKLWWELLNFTYVAKIETVIAFILTVWNATMEWVYPLISLGLCLGNATLTPLDVPKEVKSDGTSVDLEKC